MIERVKIGNISLYETHCTNTVLSSVYYKGSALLVMQKLLGMLIILLGLLTFQRASASPTELDLCNTLKTVHIM